MRWWQTFTVPINGLQGFIARRRVTFVRACAQETVDAQVNRHGQRTGIVAHTWVCYFVFHTVCAPYEILANFLDLIGGVMKIISFIERGQRDVVERILRGHQSGAMVGGLWEDPIRTLATARGPPTGADDSSEERRELQWVLDPEYL